MKKLVSLVTILCMTLCMFVVPAAADTPTISVDSIAEGDVFSEGTNIVLTADVSGMAEETIINVDFYANSDKLPGTLAGGTGSLVWYTPAAGNYAVKAIATTSGNGTVESAVVNIEVKKDVTEVIKMDSAEEVKTWKSGAWESTSVAVGDSNVSDDYAVYGSKALYIKDISYGKNTYLVNDQLDVEITAENPYLYIPIYSKADVGKYNLFAYEVTEQNGTATSSLLTRNSSSYNEIKAGWNIQKLNLTNYVGRKLNKIIINTYGYNCSGSGEKGDSYTNAEIYIGGAYMAAADPAALTATTSIPNEKSNVCNNLSKYRITFSDSIAASSAANAVKVTDITDSANPAEITDGITIQTGTDYIDVLFATGTLAYEHTYKVCVANTVTSILGGSFAGAEYTFTTIADNCTGADPVVSVVYPEAGASVATSTKLAAKVIFNDNVDKVEFYNGATLIGEAENYTGNEYQLDNAALTEGENTITAKVTLTDGATAYNSAEITVTAAAATQYAVHGIADGERILVNDRNYRTVSVIDADDVHTTFAKNTGFTTVPDATNVSKVTFIHDGAVAHTANKAPYSWNMPISNVGVEHTLSINVLDSFGNVTVYGPYKYTTVYGEVYSSNFRDFEDQNAAAAKGTYANYASTFTPAITADPDNSANTMVKVSGSQAGSGVKYAFDDKISTPLTSSVSNATRMARLTYDIRVSSVYTRIDFTLRDSYYNTNYGKIMEKSSDSSVLKANKTYKCITDIDMDNASYITYVDGVEFARGTLNSSVKDTTSLILEIDIYTWGDYTLYFDNVGITYYTHIDDNIVDIDKDGGKISAINTTDNAYAFKAINATYSGDQLASVTVDDINVPANGVVIKEYTVDASGKLFIWKDFTTLEPLTE